MCVSLSKRNIQSITMIIMKSSFRLKHRNDIRDHSELLRDPLATCSVTDTSVTLQDSKNCL